MKRSTLARRSQRIQLRALNHQSTEVEEENPEVDQAVREDDNRPPSRSPGQGMSRKSLKRKTPSPEEAENVPGAVHGNDATADDIFSAGNAGDIDNQNDQIGYQTAEGSPNCFEALQTTPKIRRLLSSSPISEDAEEKRELTPGNSTETDDGGSGVMKQTRTQIGLGRPKGKGRNNGIVPNGDFKSARTLWKATTTTELTSPIQSPDPATPELFKDDVAVHYDPDPQELQISSSPELFKDDITIPCHPDPQNLQILASPSTPELFEDDIAVPYDPDPQKLQISSLDLLPAIINNYKSRGINSLFPWQLECLSNEKVREGRNLLYSAPTTAGKTFVAEILMIRRFLKLGLKAIMILPFISVSREIVRNLKSICSNTRIRVGGFMGRNTPVGGFNAVDIAVCTIERASSLIIRLIEEDTLDSVGTLVIDELHMIGDIETGTKKNDKDKEERGQRLELLCTKILYLNSIKKNGNGGHSLQIIGMSATLPNLDCLGKWLNAEVYVTSFRPVLLTQLLMVDDKLLDKSMTPVRDVVTKDLDIRIPNDKDNVVYLSLETVLNGFSVLIFCPTQIGVEWYAKWISDNFREIGNPNPGISAYPEIGARLRSRITETVKSVLNDLERCPGGADERLKNAVKFGVGYHHAGLSVENRDVIERDFRKGILKVIVATTTLSAGVNLPARRVIIVSPEFHGKVLHSSTYQQMCGRAGRKGIDTEGESILICSRSQLKEDVKRLFKGEAQPVKSALYDKNKSLTSSMKRALLEAIAGGLATSMTDVGKYLESTFLFHSLESGLCEGNEVSSPQLYSESIIGKGVQFLKDKGFIVEQEGKPGEYLATKLGTACLASSLSPDDVLFVSEELQRVGGNWMVLSNDLHIVYQVTPIQESSDLKNDIFNGYVENFKGLNEMQKQIADLIGVEEDPLFNAQFSGLLVTDKEKDSELKKLYKRFFAAMVLNDLVNEKPLVDVCNKYGLLKGIVQNLQQQAATFAGMITTFCARMEWSNLEGVLEKFQERLAFGVKRELCDLMRLDCLDRQCANILYKAKMKTVSELVPADPAHLAKILQESDSKRGRRRIRIWDIGGESRTYLEVAHKLVLEAWTLMKNEIGEPLVLSVSKRVNEDAAITYDSGYETPSPVKSLGKFIPSHDPTFPTKHQTSVPVILMQSQINVTVKSVQNVGLIPDEFFTSCHLIGIGMKLSNSDQRQHSIALYNGQDTIYVAGWLNDCGVEKSETSESAGLEALLSRFEAHQCYIALLNYKEKLRNLLDTSGVQLLNKLSKGKGILDPVIAQWVLDCGEEWEEGKKNTSKPSWIDEQAKNECREQLATFNFNLTDEHSEALYCWKVMQKLKTNLEANGLWEHFILIEMPANIFLLIMEINGVVLDTSKLLILKENLVRKSRLLKKRAFQLAKKFNMDSPEELATILFDELKLPRPKEKGTGKEILEKLDHELPKIVLEYRRVAGVLQRFIVPLEQAIENGRVHGSYSPTVTGRFSMSSQNLQGVPSHSFDVQGEQMSLRNAFIPCSNDFVILSADYSQLELRVMAHLSGDGKLLEALNGNTDILIEVASQWKKLPRESITDCFRQQAKGIVYGAMYGKGVQTLADEMGIERGEAEIFVKEFMTAFPGIQRYVDGAIQICKEKGYAETISGRRRKLEINSDNPKKKAKAFRQAVNSQIQGSAADLMKYAMTRVYSFLQTKYPQSLIPIWRSRSALTEQPETYPLEDVVCFPILYLHDELIFEVRKTHLDQVAKEIKIEMETCMDLRVKLPVVIKTGDNWGGLLPYEINIESESG